MKTHYIDITFGSKYARIFTPYKKKPPQQGIRRRKVLLTWLAIGVTIPAQHKACQRR